MSVWKRKQKERRDGTNILPRSSWKNKRLPILKNRKNSKPYLLEIRLVNGDEADRMMQRVYGNGDWISWNHRYKTEKDGNQAIEALKVNSFGGWFRPELEYRLIYKPQGKKTVNNTLTMV